MFSLVGLFISWKYELVIVYSWIADQQDAREK